MGANQTTVNRLKINKKHSRRWGWVLLDTMLILRTFRNKRGLIDQLGRIQKDR